MTPGKDPFAHHPDLRSEIIDPGQSFFRDFTNEVLEQLMIRHNLPGGWWYSNEQQKALRRRALGDHEGDLWVFAYGSLMWDPAFRFIDVRRAYVTDYQRHFILKDIHGSRGNRRAPGLMAALDRGAGCSGLAFRIAAQDVEKETEILWRREQVLPAYTAMFVDMDLSDARISALAFVADHDASVIDANLTREQQIHYFATGKGFLGTSLDYLVNIQNHFEKLGIVDQHVTSLLADTRHYVQTRC